MRPAQDSWRAVRRDFAGAFWSHHDLGVLILDNTLYPADSGIWPRIDERITLFLVELFGIDGQSARALHKHYYSRHGATLSGLMEEHIDQVERFLEFVHDIDRSGLKPDPLLAREVGGLPGRKLIFTNGVAKPCNPHRAASSAWMDCFEDAFDIVSQPELTPKPMPRRLTTPIFFERCGVDPLAAAMFEDVTRNLAVPKAKGMTTTLVTTKAGQLDHREAHDQAISGCG